MRRVGRILITLFSCCLEAKTMAADFAFTEQSASGLGWVFAGAAALAEDPSTVCFNPAGMILLHGRQTTSVLN
jgi:long-chain fatty acid transport protein